MNFVRLVVFGFLFLSVVYICVSLYSRSVRREKLEVEWEETRPEGIHRDAFVKEGMKEYETGLRKRLILLVYIIPLIAVGAIIYFVN
ncbi:hypothetical protein [Salibaculum griseiflavum]|uniref:Cation/multidrug efflux pump n=1 Tax=Salibaculum griseiflavum TaxID=1914409 RepID=A0A2V1PA85_9RHOB|nr:hypothetical protein [Salibaculum griseiflavum]PWG18660.1 hypothetical protein DFK10_01710 [Salibaculum griseiflavum]